MIIESEAAFELFAGLMQKLSSLMKEPPKLIIFDFDGTLVEFKTDVILPNVLEFFKVFAALEDKPKFAIASNQGGVGLHYWMRDGGFGDGKHLEYPTLPEAEQRFVRFKEALPVGIELPIFVCYAYKSSKGNWATPPSFVEPDDRRWWASHRKPDAGMLIDAMVHYGIRPEESLMIGDMAEDEIAAGVAGCHFISSDSFFMWKESNG